MKKQNKTHNTAIGTRLQPDGSQPIKFEKVEFIELPPLNPYKALMAKYKDLIAEWEEDDRRRKAELEKHDSE